MMKKTMISLFMLAGLFCSCSEEFLDFSPTSSGSADALLSNASTAISALNGIYRSMWEPEWSTTGNTHQAFGVGAFNIAMEAMGDDFVMQARGNGWFWQDHCYTLKSYYTSTTYRSYDAWYGNYNWINNANNVLDYKDIMSGSPEDVSYVVGQAYTVRAFAYFNLAGWFSRAPLATLAYSRGETGPEVERWGEKCVPIYTRGSTIETQGNPRATLREVYDQIESDIDSAIVRLAKGQGSKLNTGNKSHMGLYVALGLKSRICLFENDWKGAYESACRVIEEGGYTVGGESELMGGMNSVSLPNVIWGSGISNTEQAHPYASFFGHMDNVNGEYAKSAPKRITKTLYQKIGAGDIRRRWWDPTDVTTPYVSKKFSFANVATSLGDPIYMRIEEMYFNAAEAAVRMSTENEEYLDIARNLMNTVMAPRDPSYNASRYSGTALGATTNTFRNSLLENILIQKRIELWGEFGRVADVKRLGQGIDRTEDEGFSATCLTSMKNKGVNLTNPGTWDWVQMIPKKEIDSNPQINEEDQNQ